ncbi:hypothetical protein PoB_004574300 [Plakobranchus ocellatus]|uniref:Uncharacterized protein n=1 Tax=Plakobranchus ocellatus TaxID=259542 RepID=A0AAV4BI07_9GAST|nr:hypothetical protein PoB_004574300 [Plakobranchus ocellatus]
MATSAIVYSFVKATASWTVNDLNQILIFGDYLYKEIDEQLPENEHGYLLISEIPQRISLFGTTVLSPAFQIIVWHYSQCTAISSSHIDK